MMASSLINLVIHRVKLTKHGELAGRRIQTECEWYRGFRVVALHKLM